MYRIYRKIMRRFARFVFSFERCPIDYKKDFRSDFFKLLQALVVGICTIILFLSAFIFMS